MTEEVIENQEVETDATVSTTDMLVKALRNLANSVKNFGNQDEERAKLQASVSELSQELVALASGEKEETEERDAAVVAAERKREERKLARFEERNSIDSIVEAKGFTVELFDQFVSENS